MQEKDFNHSKFSIAWISVAVIFIGTIMYPIVFQSYNARKVSNTDFIVAPPIVPNIETLAPIVEYPEVLTPVEVPITETPEPVVEKETFDRNLTVGDRGEDVKRLQEYLNNQGFLVAETGSGSIGNESTLFGKGTKEALIKFQEAYADILLKPYGLTSGTGYFGESTRNFVNS